LVGERQSKQQTQTLIRSRPDIEMPLFERYGPDILWWVKGNQNNRPS
jgi:hypothetical protein